MTEDKLVSVAVLGSLNKDLVNVCESYPKIGETVKGVSYQEFNGGKGGNQAIAIAKQEVEVSLIAKVGVDAHGSSLVTSLKEQGVDTNCIFETNKAYTGRATILLDNKTRDNAIVFSSGANGLVTHADIDASKNLFERAQFLVSQLEIPFDTVCYAFEQAKNMKVKTVLNPSPMTSDVFKILPYCSYIIVNQIELEQISSSKIVDIVQLKEVLEKISLEYELEAVIVTLGKDGSITYVRKDKKFYEIKGYKVTAVDTTGAGDTFCGALVSQLVKNVSWSDSLKYATAAAALSVSRAGAQISIPNSQEVVDFLNNN